MSCGACSGRVNERVCRDIESHGIVHLSRVWQLIPAPSRSSRHALSTLWRCASFAQTEQYLAHLGVSDRLLYLVYSGQRVADHAYRLAVRFSIGHDHEWGCVSLAFWLVASCVD